MLSQRLNAQLGLTAACLTLVTSVTILVAGASSSSNSSSAAASPVSSAPHVTPLADGQFTTATADPAQRLSMAK